RRVFSAGLQRCRVHWARNLLGHAAPKQRAAVAAMIRTIFAQDTKAEAFAQWDKVADALRDRHDKLGALMDASREDVLTYMDYTKEHWAPIESTDEIDKGFCGVGQGCGARAAATAKSPAEARAPH